MDGNNNQYLEFFAFVDSWMIQVFIIILFFTIANFVQKRTLNKLHKRLVATDNVWDDAAVEALKRPLSIFLWVIGITLAADVIQAETKAPIFELVGPIRQIGVIVCLIWFTIRLAVNVESNYIRIHSIVDATKLTTIYAIGKLIRLALIVTGGLIILQTLKISISGVLAFGGIGGIAVGFAAKDMLANFFGGLMIYMDRPFEVGHWIRSPDRDIEGVVESIGWRLTCIRTFQKRPIYIPNSVFANIIVENPSRMSHRRIYETIGVRYSDIAAVPKITRQIKDLLQQHADIDSRQTIIVNLNNFSASSIDFFVYAFTKTTNWIEYHDVKQKILLAIAEIVQQHNAEIAFPTQTIHIPEEILSAKA